MRKSRPNSGHCFPRGAPMMASPAEQVADFLVERFAPLKHADKLLARAANATPAGARNWLRRRCRPQIEHVLALYANDPAFRAEFDRVLRKTRGEE